MPPPRTLIVWLGALACACGGTPNRSVSAANGSSLVEHRVSCGALAECATKAAALCPTGYQLVGFGKSAWAEADPSIARDRSEHGEMFVRCAA